MRRGGVGRRHLGRPAELAHAGNGRIVPEPPAAIAAAARAVRVAVGQMDRRDRRRRCLPARLRCRPAARRGIGPDRQCALARGGAGMGGAAAPLVLRRRRQRNREEPRQRCAASRHSTSARGEDGRRLSRPAAPMARRGRDGQGGRGQLEARRAGSAKERQGSAATANTGGWARAANAAPATERCDDRKSWGHPRFGVPERRADRPR
jgi:hypothetical protein